MATSPKAADPLTKADTVALWHAVENFALMVKTMTPGEFSPELIAAERDRVLAAKRALRKVNKLRVAA